MMLRSPATRKRSRRPKHRDEGAAAVEFALVLPILVALLLGIIQFGWYFFVANGASAGAREAARRVVVGDCWAPDKFLGIVKAQAPTATTATFTPAQAELASSAVAVGDPVTVTVVADASLINFVPGMPSTVTREFTARLEYKSEDGACTW